MTIESQLLSDRLLDRLFPRDAQRVKLKRKEEHQSSSGAGIVKSYGKCCSLIYDDVEKTTRSNRLEGEKRAASAQAIASRSKPKEKAKVAGSP